MSAQSKTQINSNVVRVLNVVDTLHDFGKGTRVDGSVKKYVRERILKNIVNPDDQTLHSLLASKNVEHDIDHHYFQFHKKVMSPFDEIANATDVSQYINTTTQTNREKQIISIPFTSLWKLSEWMYAIFSSYKKFTLDVTSLKEEVFCKVKDKQIQKTIATKYDRNNDIYELSEFPGCVVLEHVPVALDKKDGELLFLDHVRVTNNERPRIHWNVATFASSINIDELIRNRSAPKNLTLFGEMIAIVIQFGGTENQDGGGKTLGVKKNTMKVTNKNKRKQEYVKLLTEFNEIISKIYGLDFHDARLTNTDQYVGILTDFKRLGDLLQIKVAHASNNVFVTNDIVTSVMASVAYKCATVRSGKLGRQENEDHSDRTVALYEVKTDGFKKKQQEYFTSVAHTYIDFLRAYETYQEEVTDTGPLSQMIQDLDKLRTVLRRILSHKEGAFITEVEIRSIRVATLGAKYFNVGYALLEVVDILISQMLIILLSLFNIVHSTIAYGDIIQNAEARMKEMPENMQTVNAYLEKQFETHKLPLPNTFLFQTTNLPHANEIMQIVQTAAQQIQRVLSKQFATNKKEFDEKYNLHEISEIHALHFPNPEVIALFDAFKKMNQTSSTRFYVQTEQGQMEAGYITNANKYEELGSQLEFFRNKEAQQLEYLSVPVKAKRIRTSVSPNIRKTQKFSPSEGGTRVTTKHTNVMVMPPSSRVPIASHPPPHTQMHTHMLAAPAPISLRSTFAPHVSQSSQMHQRILERKSMNRRYVTDDVLDVFLDILWNDSKDTRDKSEKEWMRVLYFQTVFLREMLHWKIVLSSR